MHRLVRLRDMNGEAMYVNPDHIVLVGGGTDDSHAAVYIVGLPPLSVIGSVQEVVNAVTGSIDLATPIAPRSSLTQLKRPN